MTKKKFILSLCLFSAFASTGVLYRRATASDHDDGENDVKSRSLNITDHYAYKDTTDTTKINFQMNSNPRSIPRQQYFFSTQARYDFHVTRVGSTAAEKATAPTGSDDMIFRFEFASPDSNDRQSITFTVMKNGSVVGTATGTTTNLTDSTTDTTASLTVNSVTVGGQAYKFFAGLREDTFFFDVDRYFKVRYFLIDRFVNANASATLENTCGGGALTTAGKLFNESTCAPDFTKDFNVNTIALQAPIAALQVGTETTFDTWSTISIPQ